MPKKLQTNASAELNAYIKSYVTGVNAAIANMTMAPPEFLLLQTDIEPWQSEDVFAVGALMAFQSGNNFRNELLRLAHL